MTDFRLHHFVLREEGLKWIKEMPKYPQFTDSLVGVMLDDIYQSEVQSAIESAILVSNQEDTLLHLRKAFAKSKNASEVVMMAKDLFPIMDQVYSLECAVEVKERFNQLSKEAYNAPDNLNRDIPLLGHYQTVAIVTFPQAKEDQPGEADKVEENRAQLSVWHEVEQLVCRPAGFLIHPEVLELLMKSYHITRKNYEG
jgi:hypothetical protein